MPQKFKNVIRDNQMSAWNIGQYLTHFFILTIIVMQPIFGCTGIMLHNKDGSTVHGRTCEFGYFFETDIAVFPRQYTITGETPEGVEG